LSIIVKSKVSDERKDFKPIGRIGRKNEKMFSRSFPEMAEV